MAEARGGRCGHLTPRCPEAPHALPRVAAGSGERPGRRVCLKLSYRSVQVLDDREPARGDVRQSPALRVTAPLRDTAVTQRIFDTYTLFGDLQQCFLDPGLARRGLGAGGLERLFLCQMR